MCCSGVINPLATAVAVVSLALLLLQLLPYICSHIVILDQIDVDRGMYHCDCLVATQNFFFTAGKSFLKFQSFTHPAEGLSTQPNDIAHYSQSSRACTRLVDYGEQFRGHLEHHSSASSGALNRVT